MIRYLLPTFFYLSLAICSAQKVTYYEGLTSFKTIQNNQTLFGFKDLKGQIIIPARYDSIIAPFRLGRSIVMLDKKYGTIDKKNNTIIPFEYKDIIQEQHGFTPVKNKNGLWGFYSYNGTLSIPCEYDNFKFFPKGDYIVVQKMGKWGIINPNNKTICDFSYKGIEIISNKQYRLIRFNKWEHKTITGVTLSSYEFDSVYFTNQDALTYTLNAWKGLMKEDGTILIPNKFENIIEFDDELVAIQQNGLWGVKKILKPEWLLDPLYNIIRIDTILIFAGLRFEHSDLVHWNVYNHSGTKLNTEIYTDYRSISNDMIAVKGINGKWGFLNTLGKLIIPAIYTSADDFKNGLTYAETNQNKYIINKSGDIVLNGQDVNLYHLGLLKLDALQNKKYYYHPDIYTELIPVDSTFIKVRQNNFYGLITSNGETVLPSIYSDIKVGNSKTTFSVVLKNQLKVVQVGIGTFPIDKKIKSIDAFYNEFAIFQYNNGEFGFIDNQGRIRIAPQYAKALPFQNEVAAIQLNGKWGFISKNETLIAQPYYEKISSFVNNVSIVKENNLYFLMDISGKILTPEGYEFIQKTDFGNYLLIKNKLSGIANKNGKEIISPRYQSINELSGTLFKVKAEGLYGIIDVNQKIILHFKYKDILFHASTQTFLTCEENFNTVATTE